MHTRTILSAAALGLILATAACGGSSTDATTTAGQGGDKLAITSPADGATVSAPFTLKWHSPVPLGPLGIDEKAIVAVNLLTNDAPVRGSQKRFELAPKAGANREWDILLGAGGMNTTVAALKVKDGDGSAGE